MSHFTKFALLVVAPVSVFANYQEQLTFEEPEFSPQQEVVVPKIKETSKPSNTFFEFNPLTLSVGGGIRYDIPDTLKAREHSVRYSPAFSRDYLGIFTYKYALLTYDDFSPFSNYSGIGFKIGMAHTSPFLDLQFIKGWRYESGPFKWGQLEINCLPVVISAYGLAIATEGDFLGIGSALFVAGLATALSFNLAF